MTIDDILNQQFQPRAPVQNDIPGILSQIFAMGQGQGMPQLPQMNTSIPEPHMMALPEMGTQGSGLVKSILGNLVSSHLSTKLKKYESESDARELTDSYGGVLGDLIKIEKNPTRKTQYETLEKLINSKNPTFQKLAVNGIESVIKGSQPDSNRTELEKNLQDSEAGPLVRATKAREGVPSGWNRDPNTGVISGMMTNSGLPYDQAILNRQMQLKQTPSAFEEDRLNISQENNDRNYQLREREAEQRRMERADAKKIAQDRIAFERLPAIPQKHIAEYVTNNASIKQIDDAIKTVQEQPEHFGPTTWLGETAGQYIDPEGIPARAKVARIGGVEFHNMAGATGTVGEQKLYKPFIPDIRTDTPEAIVERLKGLRDNLLINNKEYEDAYSSGYKTTLPGSGNTLAPSNVQYEYKPDPDNPGKMLRRRVNQ